MGKKWEWKMGKKYNSIDIGNLGELGRGKIENAR
jgi:hypothetical protein